MDWAKWHDNYKASPGLKERLKIVRARLADCLDPLPSGQIKIVSVCAGDGRDLLGLMEKHPRKNDVFAFLSENNAGLVEAGRKTIIEAGLEERIVLSRSDATLAATYAGHAPADVVIFAGVFGNVRLEETPRIIENLRPLCKERGCIIWTRHTRHNNGPAHIEMIREQFDKNDFKEIRFESTPEGTFVIGTNRYLGIKQPLTRDVKLFDFVGFDKL